MLIVMAAQAGQEDIARVRRKIEDLGFRAILFRANNALLSALQGIKELLILLILWIFQAWPTPFVFQSPINS